MPGSRCVVLQPRRHHDTLIRTPSEAADSHLRLDAHDQGPAHLRAYCCFCGVVVASMGDRANASTLTQIYAVTRTRLRLPRGLYYLFCTQLGARPNRDSAIPTCTPHDVSALHCGSSFRSTCAPDVLSSSVWVQAKDKLCTRQDKLCTRQLSV